MIALPPGLRFFGGHIVIDGVKKPESLFSLVKATLIEGNRTNSIIAFHDNSSSIRGADVRPLRPTSATGPSPYAESDDTYHLLLTAETHNFPCGVAPFPGAETGTGGRLRDTHAAGRGSLPVAGISAYCTGAPATSRDLAATPSSWHVFPPCPPPQAT